MGENRPGFGPQKGEIIGYCMCKCAKRNAFAHSRIHATVPTVGIEPEASTHAAQNVTQLTKYESSKPAIFDICRSRRFPARSVRSVGILTDLADFAHFSARSMGIPTDITDLAHFSARSVRILTDLTDIAHCRGYR